jgi:hypothetical protein
VSETASLKPAARSLPAVRLDHLWAILALSLVAALISLARTVPSDFWWHLKAGELIATEGLPTTNRFAWTLPADHPYVYQSWLGELLFYWIYRLGGFPLVIFARNLLGALAFGLVAVEAHRRSGSWRLAALAVVCAGAMTINNFTTRTQNWSWVPFILTFSILGRYVDGQLGARWLAALPLLMLFWVNAHGGFTMGLLLAGGFVAGETLRRILRQPYALPWQRLLPLYLALGATILMVFVNPLGFGVIEYVRTLLTDQSSQRLINEWQSPTPRNVAGAAFYLGLLGVIAAFALQRRRPTVTDVLILCGLAWQAFIGVRYVVWFGMAAMPIMVQALAPARSPLAGPRAMSRKERGGGGAANLVAAALLCLLVLITQPWLKPLLPLPEPYRALFADVPGAPLMFANNTPVAAVEHLRAEPCAGRMFNPMEYGSYMAWALYPAAQHFIDTRVELFPDELWLDYVALNDGQNLDALFARYDFACVVLDLPSQPALAAAMSARQGWTRSFGDAQSEVWRRLP